MGKSRIVPTEQFGFGGHGEEFGRVHHVVKVESRDLLTNSHHTYTEPG